ncbi:DUF6876 family protein [Flavobacterium sp.]|uniref:DUF6876 family protein n=1 Tax=Flavobacterium sp. TaxID=239 RepID=UPI0039E48789
MKTKTLTKADLAQFTGTENWYRHGLNRNCLYTDGVRYIADKGEAYWLIDEVALSQMLGTIRYQEFQVWTLKVNLDESKGVLTCDDGNDKILLSKPIHFTDFPMEEIRLYFVGNVILLPSEY